MHSAKNQADAPAMTDPPFSANASEAVAAENKRAYKAAEQQEAAKMQEVRHTGSVPATAPGEPSG